MIARPLVSTHAVEVNNLLNVGANSGYNAFANTNFGQSRPASAGQESSQVGGHQQGQQGLQRFGGNRGIDPGDFSTSGAASASGSSNYGVPQVNLNQPSPSTASGVGQRLSISA